MHKLNTFVISLDLKINKIKQVMRKLNHNSLKNSTQCNTSYMPQSHPTKTQNHPNTSTLCNLSPRKTKKLATSQSTTYVFSDSTNKQQPCGITKDRKNK